MAFTLLQQVTGLSSKLSLSIGAKGFYNLLLPSSSILSSNRWKSLWTKKPKIYTIDEAKEFDLAISAKGYWLYNLLAVSSEKIMAGDGAVLQPIVKSQKELKAREPSDSYVQAVIPLGSCPKIRDKYLTFKRIIRFGRLMEAFDALGVLICYRHNMDPSIGASQKSPYAFVTALVDRIEIDPMTPIDPTKDIFLEGNITWVGRSSMECIMHISQNKSGESKRLMTALFLFVCRNPLTQKAAIVSPLQPKTPEEKERFNKGETNKARRLAEAKKSLLRVPPTEEERLLIHELFLTTVDVQSGSLRAREKPDNSVWMEDTKYKTLYLCQPQERNMYNKMFGGWLMRKAFELAWVNTSLYSNTLYPMCKTVDDIIFRSPVEIGALLFMSSQVIYVCGSDIQIKVHAEVVNPETGKRKLTNDFHFTFDSSISSLPEVVPKTYAEAMMYVDGKRHYEGLKVKHS